MTFPLGNSLHGMADILAARFGKARASLLLRDAVEITETVK